MCVCVCVCVCVCACVVRLDGIFVHVDGRVSGLVAGHICVLLHLCVVCCVHTNAWMRSVLSLCAQLSFTLLCST